jgi:PAS domain S-box-containing protein
MAAKHHNFWISILLILGYALFFGTLYPFIGLHVLVLSIFPAIYVAWQYGFTAGLAVTLFQIILHFMVPKIYGQPFVATFTFYLQSGSAIGTLLSLPLLIISALLSRWYKANKSLNEYYRLICDHTYNWEYWENSQGTLVYTSKSCERITGYAADDFMQYPQLLEAIIYPQDKAVVAKHWLQNLQERELHMEDELIFRIFTRDHRICWIQHVCLPVFGDDGRFQGRRVSHRDITLQKLAEENLVRMSQMLDSAPGLIMVHDAEGNILYANERAADYHGYPVEEFLRLQLKDLTAPESSNLVAARIRDILAKSRLAFESIHIRKDRSIFTLMVEVRTVIWGENQVLLNVSTDISKLKWAEEQLKFRNLLLSTQQEASLDGILVVGESGEILSHNKIFAAMWKIPVEVLALKSDEAALQCILDQLTEPAQFLEKVKQLYVQRAQTSHDEIGLKDGRTFDRYSTPMISENGDYFGRVWYFRDITKNKEDETERVQNQKLSSIGQLASGIAHEINTPTQFIGDNIRFIGESFQQFIPILKTLQQLAQAPDVPAGLLQEIQKLARVNELDYIMEEIPKALVETTEGVNRVASIVRAMKEFAHPESKDKISSDLNQIIQNTVTVSKNEWKYVAEVTMDLDPTLPLVFCLPGEIGQVILNLIVNAAQTIGEKLKTGGNPGRIALATRYKNDQVEVRISDTGLGIPESIQHRIFDPFFTTKKTGIGSGQGLAIAQAIINKKHNGKIVFETQDGVGTTFKIFLPLADTFSPCS